MHLWFIASCSSEVLYVGNIISIELNNSCLWELSCAMSGDWQHPCLYLLKISSTPSVVTTTNVYRHCQVIPGGANLPLIESHAIVCFLLAHKLMAWLKVDWISELVKYHSCFKVSLHILILLRFSVFHFSAHYYLCTLDALLILRSSHAQSLEVLKAKLKCISSFLVLPVKVIWINSLRAGTISFLFTATLAPSKYLLSEWMNIFPHHFIPHFIVLISWYCV